MSDRLKQIEDAAKRLREWVTYDSLHGELISKSTGNAYKSVDVHGYVFMYAHGRKWRVHRVIWYFEKGTLPDVVDHVDGNRLNNHISNLREASFKQNSYNCKRKTNSSPYKGVTKAKTGRYRACITADGKKEHLGYFKTPEEAARAYNSALLKLDPSARLNEINPPHAAEHVGDMCKPTAPGRDDERDALKLAQENAVQSWDEKLIPALQRGISIGMKHGRKGFVPASEVESFAEKYKQRFLDHSAMAIRECNKAVAEAREAARKEERERCGRIVRHYHGIGDPILSEILNPAPSESEGG